MQDQSASLSPSGQYEVVVFAWEARMSLWVETPRIVERASGEVLLRLCDSHWSLNAAEWQSDHVVALHLRKYPGSHAPPELVLTLDCARRSATLDDTVVPFGAVEAALERALTWPAQAREVFQPGWRGLLARLYRLWRTGRWPT